MKRKPALKKGSALGKGPPLRKGTKKKKGAEKTEKTTEKSDKDQGGEVTTKKVPKGILKKPGAAPSLGQDGGAGMSLEEKMEMFAKKGNRSVSQFLDGLSKNQREALWQRFASARQSLKDPEQDAAWNTHCKGKGSEENKKALLGVFLKCKGNLKKNDLYQRELLALVRTSGLGRTQSAFKSKAFLLHIFI